MPLAAGMDDTSIRPWTAQTSDAGDNLMVEYMLHRMESMSDEDRQEVFRALGSKYCQHCGGPQPDGRYCQCTNDE